VGGALPLQKFADFCYKGWQKSYGFITLRLYYFRLIFFEK